MLPQGRNKHFPYHLPGKEAFCTAKQREWERMTYYNTDLYAPSGAEWTSSIPLPWCTGSRCPTPWDHPPQNALPPTQQTGFHASLQFKAVYWHKKLQLWSHSRKISFHNRASRLKVYTLKFEMIELKLKVIKAWNLVP